MKKIDIKGKTFGNWEAIKTDDNNRKNWICRCNKCGTVHSVNGMALRSGKTAQCHDCYEKEHKKGDDWLKLKAIFKGIKQRCYYDKSPCYDRYGGRGIRICDEWLNNRDAFPRWALANGYEPGLTIDRIDNDGDYSPSNCRWVTAVIQNNNKRSNIFIEYGGRRQTISQWAKELGMSRDTIKWRYLKGLPPEMVLDSKSKRLNLSKYRKTIV